MYLMNLCFREQGQENDPAGHLKAMALVVGIERDLAFQDFKKAFKAQLDLNNKEQRIVTGKTGRGELFFGRRQYEGCLELLLDDSNAIDGLANHHHSSSRSFAAAMATGLHDLKNNFSKDIGISFNGEIWSSETTRLQYRPALVGKIYLQAYDFLLKIFDEQIRNGIIDIFAEKGFWIGGTRVNIDETKIDINGIPIPLHRDNHQAIWSFSRALVRYERDMVALIGSHFFPE